MTQLILGAGEVGTAISKILPDAVLADRKGAEGTYDVLHICFPYKKHYQFVDSVLDAIQQYAPKLTIIHSTVGVGTTDEIAYFSPCVHSPVRGVHPNLEEGIRTFIKYFGGKREDTELAAQIFEDAGVKTELWNFAKETELAKILSTTYYGLQILFEKEVYELTTKQDLSYTRIYENWNESYNEGYTKLGMENVVRPVLRCMSGGIGGHCVLPNAKLLGGKLGRLILKWNKRYK